MTIVMPKSLINFLKNKKAQALIARAFKGYSKNYFVRVTLLVMVCPPVVTFTM